MQSWLEDANIKSKVILDSAVGYVAKPPVGMEHALCHDN